MAPLHAYLINARKNSAPNNNNNDIETETLPHCYEAKMNMYHSTAFLELQQQVTEEAGDQLATQCWWMVMVVAKEPSFAIHWNGGKTMRKLPRIGSTGQNVSCSPSNLSTI
jgi:hypothetical protein